LPGGSCFRPDGCGRQKHCGLTFPVQSAGRGKSGMIYIVEDDASIRELEQYALQTNDFEVQGFEDVKRCWNAVHTRLPELVILDVMLPDEDGYAILSRLREDAATRTIPVIMVTAKTSEIDVVRGLDHGADDYISKPFGVLEFISRVKAVLRRAAADAPAAAGVLRYD